MTLEEIAAALMDMVPDRKNDADYTVDDAVLMNAAAALTAERALAEKAETDLIKTTALAIRMEAERDRIRAETIEECAKVAASDYAYGIATAIRALGDKA